MKATKYAGGMNLTSALRESQYGTPQPTLRLDAPRGTPHRVVGACLHRLAAAVEDATPDREGWIVQIQNEETWGRVYLELADGSAGEAARGMTVIEAVAKAAQ